MEQRVGLNELWVHSKLRVSVILGFHKFITGCSNLNPGGLTLLSKFSISFEKQGCASTLATLSPLKFGLMFGHCCNQYRFRNDTSLINHTATFKHVFMFLPTHQELVTKRLRKLLQVITGKKMQVTNLLYWEVRVALILSSNLFLSQRSIVCQRRTPMLRNTFERKWVIIISHHSNIMYQLISLVNFVPTPSLKVTARAVWFLFSEEYFSKKLWFFAAETFFFFHRKKKASPEVIF